MKPDDYLEKIEQHRQEIQVAENGEEDRIRSRRELRKTGRKTGAKKTSSKKSSKILTTMFGLFILIPVGFLIYVVAFYEPEPMETATKDNQFKMEVSTPEKEVASGSDEQEAPTQNSETNEPTEVEQPELNDEDPAQPEEVEAAPVEEQPEETQPDTEERTHVVAPGETLFRIAMNYYGSPEGVEKIKAANGLSSNEISAGQTLVIP